MICLKKIPLNRQIVFFSLVILFLAAAFAYQAWQDRLDPDELESLYASWLIQQGSLPYRDFYQIHTPLFYYSFAPLFNIYGNLKVIDAARIIVWVLAVLNGYLIFLLSRRFFNLSAGLWAFICYLSSFPVVNKMGEVRPDLGVIIFTNLALLMLVTSSFSRIRAFFYAGIFTVLAILSKQSGFLFLVAISVFFSLRWLIPSRFFRGEGVFFPKNYYFRTVSSFYLGIFLSFLTFLFLLQISQSGRAFWLNAFQNDFGRVLFKAIKTDIHWPVLSKFRKILAENFVIYLFALLSLGYLFRAKFFPNRERALFFLVFISFFSGGIFLILHPWVQDFIFLANYIAILAGFSLALFTTEIIKYFNCRGQKMLAYFFLVLILIGISKPYLRYLPDRGRDYRGKIEFFNRVLAFTNEDDLCFSPLAPCLFRPSLYHYRLGTVWTRSERALKQIEPELVAAFKQGKVDFLLTLGPIYTNAEFLPEVLAKRYVFYPWSGPELFVPGQKLRFDLSGEAELAIFKEGYYVFQNKTKEVIFLDGRKIDSAKVFLCRGKHKIVTSRLLKEVTVYYDLVANKR